MKKKGLLTIAVILAMLTGCATNNGGTPEPQTPAQTVVQTEEATTGVQVEETTPAVETEPAIPDDAAYSITISINPLVELIISKDNTVLAVNCLNADSEIAYSDIVEELVGKEAGEATKEIVNAAVEQGYLKENAACTITCDTVYNASEEIIEHISEVKEAAAVTLKDAGREDAVLKVVQKKAIEELEKAGIEVDEAVKAEQEQIGSEEPAAEGADQAFWPNLLIVVDESTRCKKVVYLNDSANHAYAGVNPKDAAAVIGKADLEAAKPYIAAAVDNGYLRAQFKYSGKYDVPHNIFDTLVIFRSEYEAIAEGLIPIPKEFYNSPSIAAIVDDDGIIQEVIYLNESAKTVYANVDMSKVIGAQDMEGIQPFLHVLYAQGYINNFDIPIPMYEYLVKIFNEEEAVNAGLK